MRVNLPQRNMRSLGFTMLEIVLVLIIGLGLVVSGLSYYRTSQTKTEAAEAIRSIGLTISEIDRIYGPRGPYNNITIGVLDPSGSVYLNGLGRSSDLPASFFKDQIVSVAHSGAGYCMTLLNIPRSTCRMMHRHMDLPNGFTGHPARCTEDPTAFRVCKRP